MENLLGARAVARKTAHDNEQVGELGQGQWEPLIPPKW